MLRRRYQATAPLLVPLLLCSLTALAAPPSGGRVIGPAPALSGRPGGPGRPVARLAAMPMAGSPACTVYFDATGQLNFNPPPANTPLTPGISSANFIRGGPAFAHGKRVATALGVGRALFADTGINGVSQQQPVAAIKQLRIRGIAYFATDTSCRRSSFTTTVQSSPAGNTAAYPAGTVLAQSNIDPAITMAASYIPSYATDGITYTCIFGNGNGNGNNGNSVPCSVWRVDVMFSFLTNSFRPNGAGGYSLTINQVTMTSP